VEVTQPWTSEDARRVAEKYLDDVFPADQRAEIVTTTVWEYETCWMVGYQTRAFVESGSWSDALAGGGPVIINKGTGQVRMGTSTLPPEQQQDAE
jgi:hypothetical protein